MENVKDMGTANAWDRGTPVPVEMLAHEQAIKAGEHHVMKSRTVGRCLTETTCETCGIKWTTDSSD